jgi:hypothetical protein
MKLRPELSFALSLFIVPLFAFVDAAIPFPSRRAQAASGSIVPGEFILEMAATASLGPKRGVISVRLDHTVLCARGGKPAFGAGS